MEEKKIRTEGDGARVQHETKVFQARDSQGKTWIESFQTDNADRLAMVNLFVPLHRQLIQLFPGLENGSGDDLSGTGTILAQRRSARHRFAFHD